MSFYLIAAISMASVSNPTEDLKVIQSTTTFSFGTHVTVTNTPVRVMSVDLDPPEGGIITDLEASISDEVDLSSTTVGASFSYFPKPFWEISISGGLVSMESDTQIDLSGSISEESVLTIEEFDISTVRRQESEGFGYGLGTAIYLPIAELGRRPLIARAGVQISANDIDDVETKTLAANITLINVQRLVDRDVTLALGGTYIEIERQIDYDLLVGGESVGVSFTQELETPWSATATAILPINERTGLSFSVTNNFDGLSSYGLRLNFRY